MLVLTPRRARMQLWCAGAHRLVDRELRRALRGSCEQARAGSAALSTTAARTRGVALAPSAAGRAMDAVAVACVPMSTRAARLPLGATSAPRLVTRLAPALAAGSFVPSGGDIQRRPRRGGLAECSALGRRVAQCAPTRRSTRALRSGRGAQAQGSVRAWEREGDRAYRAAPTRSTGHRLASVWSSPDAAGRDRRGFVRRSGTALSGPCPTGV